MSDLVAIERAAVRYGRRPALDDVSVSVGSGELVWVRGPNGAGKSTLLRLLAGVIEPNRGRRVGRPTVAYLPSAMAAPPVDVGHWLDGVQRHRRAAAEQTLDALGYTGTKADLCTSLSLGNFRKVLLADVFSAGVSLLVLDEPENALDPTGVGAVASLAQQAADRGAAVVVAQHEGLVVQSAGSVWDVQDGRVDVSSAGEDRSTELTLRGPRAKRADLIEAARRLGFHVDRRRS